MMGAAMAKEPRERRLIISGIDHMARSIESGTIILLLMIVCSVSWFNALADERRESKYFIVSSINSRRLCQKAIKGGTHRTRMRKLISNPSISGRKWVKVAILPTNWTALVPIPMRTTISKKLTSTFLPECWISWAVLLRLEKALRIPCSQFEKLASYLLSGSEALRFSKSVIGSARRMIYGVVKDVIAL